MAHSNPFRSHFLQFTHERRIETPITNDQTCEHLSGTLHDSQQTLNAIRFIAHRD